MSHIYAINIEKNHTTKIYTKTSIYSETTVMILIFLDRQVWETVQTQRSSLFAILSAHLDALCYGKSHLVQILGWLQHYDYTVMIPSLHTDRPGQTAQTQSSL